MLAQRRTLATAALRCMSTATQFDFSTIQGYVKTPDAKAEMDGFLRQMNEVTKGIESVSSKKEINWDHWQSTIRWPGLVDSFKDAASNVKVEKMQDTFSPELQKAFAEAAASLRASAQKSQQRVAELDSLLKEIEARPSGRLLTIEEAYKAQPEAAKEIEEEIKQNKWY